MARKVFFSFHYERDAQRAAIVRNCDMIPNDDEYGVIDRAEWETIERGGDRAIREWILSQLKHTTATVVLIGTETASRDWVHYEIKESWERGNAIVGLRIHAIKSFEQKTDPMGVNPLDLIKLEDGRPLSSVCPTYDWIANDGRNNLGTWVEAACQSQAECDRELARSAPTSPITAAGPAIIKNPPRPWAK